jgi:chorismate mutase/prephenate dehydrogenase
MTPSAKSSPALAALRQELSTVDAALIDLLRRRVELARRVGAEKRAEGLPVLDPKREAQVVANAARHARQAGLAEESVRDIFWPIVAMCRRAQQEDRA